MTGIGLLLFVSCAGVVVVEEDEHAKTVLVMDLLETNSDAGVAQLVGDQVTASLSELEGYKVISGADIRRVAGLESERQAAGCETDTSCIAEIAGALGAGTVVFGSVGKLGEVHVVNLAIYDDKKASVFARVDIRTERLAEIPVLLRAELRRALGIAAVVVPEEPSMSALKVTGIGLAAGGAALAIACGLATLPFEETLGDGATTTLEKNNATAAEGLFITGAVLGVVVAGAGVALFMVSE